MQFVLFLICAVRYNELSTHKWIHAVSYVNLKRASSSARVGALRVSSVC